MRPTLQAAIGRDQSYAADMIVGGNQALQERYEGAAAFRLDLTIGQFLRRRIRHPGDDGELCLDRCRSDVSSSALRSRSRRREISSVAK